MGESGMEVRIIRPASAEVPGQKGNSGKGHTLYFRQGPLSDIDQPPSYLVIERDGEVRRETHLS